MVQICCVEGCDDEKDGLMYFKVRTGQNLKKWLARFKPLEKISDDSMICSQHFFSCEIAVDNGLHRLKKNVMPSIFSQKSNELLQKAKDNGYNVTDLEPDVDENLYEKAKREQTQPESETIQTGSQAIQARSIAIRTESIALRPEEKLTVCKTNEDLEDEIRLYEIRVVKAQVIEFIPLPLEPQGIYEYNPCSGFITVQLAKDMGHINTDKQIDTVTIRTDSDEDCCEIVEADSNKKIDPYPKIRRVKRKKQKGGRTIFYDNKTNRNQNTICTYEVSDDEDTESRKVSKKRKSSKTAKSKFSTEINNSIAKSYLPLRCSNEEVVCID